MAVNSPRHAATRSAHQPFTPAPSYFRTLALFLAWAILLLWPALLAPQSVLLQPGAQFSDLLISHWPNAEFLRRSLFEYHQFPLWNPQILGGAPFAADPLAGLWYPPNWLTVILPLPFAFNLLFALHLAWGGWGLYRWARVDGFGFWPALVGGLAYAAMPKVIAHIAAGHVSLVFAVSWMPWLLQILDFRLRIEVGASRIMRPAPAALIWSLIFFADARWGVYAGIVLVVWWLAHNRSWIGAGRLILCALYFLLITAILWLPLLEFVGHSSRAELTTAEAAIFSLTPKYLLGVLIPYLGGNQEYMTTLGLAPLTLAIIGAVKGSGRDRAGVLTMIGLGLGSLWWALGPSAGLFALGSRLPLLSLLRVPARAWFIVGLAVCWLAVRGAAAIEDGFRLKGRAWNLATIGLAGALWILAIGGSVIAKKALANFLITAMAVTGVLIALRLKPALIALTVVAVVELLAINSTLIASHPVVRNPVAEWLSARPGVWRVYSPSYSLPALDAARSGLEQADGVNPLQLAETVTYMDAAGGVERRGYSVTVPPFEAPAGGEPVNIATANRDAVPDVKLLGDLNVRFVVSEFDIETDGLQLQTRIGDTRIYENLLDAGRARGGALASWSPNRIVVRADGPGRVTLAEVWYPGWVATVDGVPAEIERDRLFRSLTVETGGREIVFEFRPASFFIGVGLSIIGLIVMGYATRLRARNPQPITGSPL